MKRSRRTNKAASSNIIVVRDRDPQSGVIFCEAVSLDHALMLCPDDWPADVLTRQIQTTLQLLQETVDLTEPHPLSVERLLFRIVGLALQLKRHPRKHRWAMQEGTAHRKAIDSIDLVYLQIRRGVAGMKLPKWSIVGTSLTRLIMLIQCQSFDVCRYLENADTHAKELLLCPDVEEMMTNLETELQQQKRERSQLRRFWNQRLVAPSVTSARSTAGKKSADSRKSKALIKQREAETAIVDCCRDLITKGENPTRDAVLRAVMRIHRGQFTLSTLRRWFPADEMTQLFERAKSQKPIR